jgi:hypothetical protein
MMIDSLGSADRTAQIAMVAPPVDNEAAEARPDNEAAEATRTKAPLGAGQGSKIDVEA